MGGDCYEITSGTPWPGSPAPFEFGAVWFNQQLDLTAPFTIEVEVGLGDDDGGADGIVMVLQTAGPMTIGVGGEGLGFGGIAPSFGVEIDTHFNADNLPNYPFGDVSQDHVAFQRDGVIFHDLPYFNLAGPNPALPSGANIEDGELHFVKLDWDPGSNLIEFYFDCELRLTLNIDLVDEIFNGQSSVWWGFTGATGGLVNQQTACITSAAVGLLPYHEICAGDGVQLELQSAQPGTVTWSPVDGLSDASIPNPVAAPEVTTTYTATWTNVCGDQLTAETEVAVNPAPEVELPEEASFCPGEQVELDVDIPLGASAEWSDGSMGGIWIGDEVGWQSVVVEGPGGCAASDSTWIEALSPAEVAFPDVQPLCDGDAQAIEWPSGTGGWSVDGAAVPSPWLAGPGTYLLEWVDDLTGCPASLDFEIDLVEPEPASLNGAFATCGGSGVTLDLDAGAGATVTWTPVEGLDDPAAEQPVATPESSTVYTAEVLDICGNLTELITEVNVFDVPDPGLPDTVAFCPGNSASLEVVPLPGVPQPQWSDGTVGWNWNGTVEGWQSVIVSPLPECPGVDSAFILPHQPESPQLEADPLCPGEFAFIPWPDAWTGWQVDGTPADPSGLTVTSPGVFFLVAEETATGCDVAGSVVVPNGSLPEMGLPDYLEFCEDQPVLLDAGVPDPVFWNDGTSGSLRDIDGPGVYIATHTTPCGSVTDSVQVVEVPCGCAVFAPSAFTPDGDFINDAWRPSFECDPDEYHLKIFDRWGGLIWQTENPDEYWTGGYREDGRPLEQKLYYVRDGIYAFQVTYRDPSSVVRKIIRKTGHVMILR